MSRNTTLVEATDVAINRLTRGADTGAGNVFEKYLTVRCPDCDRTVGLADNAAVRH